jgi:hypothetical protein
MSEAFDEYSGLHHMQMGEFEIKTTESLKSEMNEKSLVL